MTPGDNMPWPEKYVPPYVPPLSPPNPTQYQVYSQLTKYCAQKGFWTDAKTAADNSIAPIVVGEEDQAPQNALVQLYNNSVASQSCSDRTSDGNNGTADNAVDGGTYSYSNNTCTPPSTFYWKLELNQPEYLDEIILYAARDTDDALIGSIPSSIQFQNAASTILYTILPITSQETQSLKVQSADRMKLVKIIYIPSTARIRELKLYRHLKPVLNTSNVPTAAITTAVATNINLVTSPIGGTSWVTATYYPKWDTPLTLASTNISVVVKDSSGNLVVSSANPIFTLAAGTYQLEYTATEPAPYILTSQPTRKSLTVTAQ